MEGEQEPQRAGDLNRGCLHVRWTATNAHHNDHYFTDNILMQVLILSN
jgi:hypothetical protein